MRTWNERKVPTHEVDNQLLGFEIFLHFHPDAIELQLLEPFFLLCRIIVEDGLLRLLVGDLVPL